MNGRARARTSRAIMRRFHPELDFGGFTDIDGTVIFYARVHELLRPDSTALDIGCGRGTQADDPVGIRRELRIIRGKCGSVLGIDVDPAAAENAFVDEFRLIDAGGRWPVETGSVDLAVADFVLEHVSDPGFFLTEAARTLRPGAPLCIRTINAWSYLGIVSRFVPRSLHVGLLSRVQPDRRAEDMFPTRYRCNTVGRLRRALDRAGFDAVVYSAEAEPSYLGFNPIAYRLGLAHRRLAPSRLRVGLIAWGRRRKD